ncbi:MAG: DUF4256 domain-containing protein [Culicoidibacterales bacterium]
MFSQIEMQLLLESLQQRFVTNQHRHPQITWEMVRNVLLKDSAALVAVHVMEVTGGEPDVVTFTGIEGIVFVDCALESPKLRRSLCYDEEALEKRKANKPVGSAIAWAQAHQLQLLTPEQYQAFQKFGPFDQKTSSWLQTPTEVREQGGALFGDYRYGRTFIYHNGADSYYASRGLRTMYVVLDATI